MRRPGLSFAIARPGGTLQWVLGGSAAAAALGGVVSLKASFGGLLLVAVLAGLLYLRWVYSLLILLVAAVFLEAVSLGGLTVTRLVAPVALILTVSAVARGVASFRGGPPARWAAGYAFWAFASELWTVDGGATRYLLASLVIALIYVFAFASLVSATDELVGVMYAFAVTSFFLGLFAIASYLGLAGSHTLQEGRASGGTGDANFFAAGELITIPIVLALTSIVVRPRVRNALYAVLAVDVASVLTSLSRGGLVALAAVLLTAVVLPSRTVFRSPRQKAVAMLLIAVAAGVAFKGLSGQFAPRIQAVISGTDTTGSGRQVLWSGAWTSVKERPLLGLGYGSFKGQSNDLVLRTPGASLTQFRLKPTGEEAHNAYLGTLAELGIPGLALFLGVLVSTWRFLNATARRARVLGEPVIARSAGALTLSLVGWAVASIFLSSETSRPLWIIVGLSLALAKLLARAEGASAELEPASGADDPPASALEPDALD